MRRLYAPPCIACDPLTFAVQVVTSEAITVRLISGGQRTSSIGSTGNSRQRYSQCNVLVCHLHAVAYIDKYLLLCSLAYSLLMSYVINNL